MKVWSLFKACNRMKLFKKLQVSRLSMSKATCVLAVYLPTLLVGVGAQEKASAENKKNSYSQLNSVSFVNPNDGWAVGSAGVVDNESALCAHWDGKSWTSVVCLSTPKSSLFAVKAISSQDVWAVGVENSDAVVIRWDGSKWSHIPLDPEIKNPITLNALSGTSARDIWTAGITASQDNVIAVIQHWNGKEWKISYRATGPKFPLALIPDLSAAAENNAWAILNAWMEDKVSVLLHWDGEQWKQFSISGDDIYYIRGVFAASSNDAWAVGEANGHSMVARWNGASWRVIESAPAGDDDELTTVVGVSAKELWAAGTRHQGSSLFFEHWDGANWGLVDPKQGGEIDSLSVLSPSDIWAVGQQTTYTMADKTTALTGITDALIAHWDGKKWTFTTPFASTSY